MNDCQKIEEIVQKIKNVENLINKLWLLYYREQYQKADFIDELQVLYEIFSALQKDVNVENLVKNGEKLLKKRRKKTGNDVFLIKSLRYYNNNGLDYEKYLELMDLRINFFDKLLKEKINIENLADFFTQITKHKNDNIYSEFLRDYGVKKDIMQRIRNNTQTFLQKNYKKLSENLKKNYKKLPLKKDSEIANQKKFIGFLCEKNELIELEKQFCLQKINFSFKYDNENLCNTINFFAYNAGILLSNKALGELKINLRAEKIILLKNIYAFLLQFHLCRSEEFAEYVVNFWCEELKINKKTFNAKNLHRTMNAFCNENNQIFFDELSFVQEISDNTQVEYNLMYQKPLDKVFNKKEIKSKKIIESSDWLRGNFFQNHLILCGLICAHRIMEHFLQDEKRHILVNMSNGNLAPVHEFITKNINNDEFYNITKEDCEKYLEYLKKKS